MSGYEKFQLEKYGNVLPASPSGKIILTYAEADEKPLNQLEQRHYECLNLLQQIDIQKRLVAQDEAALRRYDRQSWADRDLNFGIVATKQLANRKVKIAELKKQYALVLSTVFYSPA